MTQSVSIFFDSNKGKQTAASTTANGVVSASLASGTAETMSKAALASTTHCKHVGGRALGQATRRRLVEKILKLMRVVRRR